MHITCGHDADDDALLDEMDLSEEEGKDNSKAAERQEARERARMEAEVTSCLHFLRSLSYTGHK